ncbi:hypothetical protein DBR37_04555 [Herminiimonas sp. KBW02]|nr:hypothetical protein DBR37_04555 [Herminiimonas sp. KBW02]
MNIYRFKLSAWLKTEAATSRKQRRTLKKTHIDLCALGFDGSYDRVSAFARRWKVDQFSVTIIYEQQAVLTKRRTISDGKYGKYGVATRLAG